MLNLMREDFREDLKGLILLHFYSILLQYSLIGMYVIMGTNYEVIRQISHDFFATFLCHAKILTIFVRWTTLIITSPDAIKNI